MLKPLLRLPAAATDRVPSLRFAYGAVGIAAAGGLARVLLRRLMVEISIADDARSLSNVVLTAALVVVAALWLWFLLAYAEWIFRHFVPSGP